MLGNPPGREPPPGVPQHRCLCQVTPGGVSRHGGYPHPMPREPTLVVVLTNQIVKSEFQVVSMVISQVVSMVSSQVISMVISQVVSMVGSQVISTVARQSGS